MFENILSSKFYTVCNGLARLLVLTILFILFSLPIVTVGVSFVALITAIRQPEYNTLTTFWQTFKENILRGSVVLIFTGFTVLFLAQFWQFSASIPAGNIIFIFVLIFLIVYNLNAYLFVSILKKSNLTFFRQVFFFTIGTLYKTFLVPIIAFVFLFVAPIIGGYLLMALSVSMVLAIYVKIVAKDLETLEAYL